MQWSQVEMEQLQQACLAKLDELSNRLDACKDELHIFESEVKVALLDVEQRKRKLDE